MIVRRNDENNEDNKDNEDNEDGEDDRDSSQGGNVALQVSDGLLAVCPVCGGLFKQVATHSNKKQDDAHLNYLAFLARDAAQSP
jgi:hypothetical protein